MKDKVDVFMECGMRRPEAKVLIYLFRHTSAFSRNIEHEMDLRQPEVSLAMSTFLKRKWIKTVEQKKETKGRPTIEYSLAVDNKKVILELKKDVNNRLKLLYNTLDKLDKLVI